MTFAQVTSQWRSIHLVGPSSAATLGRLIDVASRDGADIVVLEADTASVVLDSVLARMQRRTLGTESADTLVVVVCDIRLDPEQWSVVQRLAGDGQAHRIIVLSRLQTPC